MFNDHHSSRASRALVCWHLALKMFLSVGLSVCVTLCGAGPIRSERQMQMIFLVA